MKIIKMKLNKAFSKMIINTINNKICHILEKMRNQILIINKLNKQMNFTLISTIIMIIIKITLIMNMMNSNMTNSYINKINMMNIINNNKMISINNNSNTKKSFHQLIIANKESFNNNTMNKISKLIITKTKINY